MDQNIWTILPSPCPKDLEESVELSLTPAVCSEKLMICPEQKNVVVVDTAETHIGVDWDNHSRWKSTVDSVSWLIILRLVIHSKTRHSLHSESPIFMVDYGTGDFNWL